MRRLPLLLATAAIAFAQRKPFDGKALLDLKRIADPQISPDGQTGAFQVHFVNVEAVEVSRLRIGSENVSAGAHHPGVCFFADRVFEKGEEFPLRQVQFSGNLGKNQSSAFLRSWLNHVWMRVLRPSTTKRNIVMMAFILDKALLQKNIDNARDGDFRHSTRSTRLSIHFLI